MLENEGNRLVKVLVCAPGDEYFLVTDLHAHHMNAFPDPEKTAAQFRALKSILEARGTEVIDVPELEGHPNSVFTRDVAVCTPRGYIRLRMGLDARRGEEAWMADHLDSLGEPCAGEITAPGTAEGGDIILLGSVAFVGHSCRTNAEGVKQLSAMLTQMGYEVRVAKVPLHFLHLGGIMSAVGPERILCCRDLFADDFFRNFDTVDIPSQGASSGNVICMGRNEVIANAAENAEAIQSLEDRGVTVHGIDLSEFRKGAGGPSCLILPVERR